MCHKKCEACGKFQIFLYTNFDQLQLYKLPSEMECKFINVFQWMVTGECPITSGIGQEMHIRKCDNLSPEYGVSSCQGRKIDVRACNQFDCTCKYYNNITIYKYSFGSLKIMFDIYMYLYTLEIGKILY